jgi:hypothetical protein
MKFLLKYPAGCDSSAPPLLALPATLLTLPSEHTDRAYFSSEKHVITLEMLKHNGDGQATRQVQLQQSANSTGLNLG